jgi:RNA recognition motif-containing protein
MDQNNKIFVGNLPWSLRDENLRELFSQFGEIVEAIVIMERRTGRSKGFGFVTFQTPEAAQSAVEGMHGKEVEGRNIVANIARPREDRPRDDRPRRDYRD